MIIYIYKGIVSEVEGMSLLSIDCAEVWVSGYLGFQVRDRPLLPIIFMAADFTGLMDLDGLESCAFIGLSCQQYIRGIRSWNSSHSYLDTAFTFFLSNSSSNENSSSTSVLS